MKTLFRISVVLLAFGSTMLLPAFGLDLAGQNTRWPAVGAVAHADQPNQNALSIHGNAYSEDIQELRIYRTRDPDLRFYDVLQLNEKRMLFRSRDKEIIAAILQAANLGPPVGEPSGCGPLKMDYQLHDVTLREGTRVFGYFIVSPSEALRAAPPELIGNCANVAFSHGTVFEWHSYDFFAALRTLGILE